VPLADSTLVRLPEGATAEQALFVGDILATAFFCAEMAEVGPGSRAVVVGCGPVGLLSVLAAWELGAERVLAVDSVPERLALARRLGAEPVPLAEEETRAAVLEATEGRGADAVLEAVGLPAASRLAIDLVRPGGVIAAAGFHAEPQFAFGPGDVYAKNLTYRSGRCPARRFMERLLPRVAEGRYPLELLITHRLSLGEAVRAYELFDRKLDGCIKVLLTP
jgi:threonine dehydrogenase-like Zn-dependent dehydrogenase